MKKENESPYCPVLDIRELPDGNFTIVVDGDYLRENMPEFGPDFKLQVDLTYSNHLCAITHSKFRRTFIPYSSERARKDLDAIMKRSNKSTRLLKIKQFAKLHGPAALETEPIRSYIYDTICKAREEHSSKGKKSIISSINSIVYACSESPEPDPFLDASTKKRVSNKQIDDFCNEHYQKASILRKIAMDYCTDCAGREQVPGVFCCKNLLKGKKEGKRICSEFLNSDNMKNWLAGHSVELAIEILKSDSASDYVRRKISKEFRLSTNQSNYLRKKGSDLSKLRAEDHQS